MGTVTSIIYTVASLHTARKPALSLADLNYL